MNVVFISLRLPPRFFHFGGHEVRRCFSAQGVGLALLALAWLLLLPAQVAASSRAEMPGTVPACGGQVLPPGWPDFSSEDRRALLAPFLACSSPADFLALQQRVDMPRLVMRLDDWGAVRLGSLGPVREEAAGVLNRKRTSFLLQSPEHYGAANAEVLAHFVLDSSHDDDLGDILTLLARDKRLQEVLELLPSLGPALEEREIKPSAHAERDFQWSDVGRGMARAGRDALSTIPLVEGAQSRLMELSTIREQLPPPYQEALDVVEREQLERRFSKGHLAVGLLDHMTFGVPLGFYSLVAGTGHGAYALGQGRYEQAVRELTPAVLLVTVYAGGKGARFLSEARGSTGGAPRVPGGLEVMESRVKGFQEVARQWKARLGVEGLRELARDIQASREAGRFVAVGGADAALALREARGDVARAQAMMSKARPESTVSSTVGRPGLKTVSAAEHSGSLSSLVDHEAGLTQQVVEAKLAAAEIESTSPRLPNDVAVLEKQRPALDASPPGAQDNPRWREYVAYYERRMGELKEGKTVKGPLRWAAYETMWNGFTRGLVFERFMVKLLRADAKLPRAQRRFLGDFDKPRIESYVGVRKTDTGLRYADVLIVEEGELAGPPRRVETLSLKSRNLSGLEPDALAAQMIEDAKEALRKYGQTLDIRRDSLQPLLREGSEVPVQRVRLIYEGGDLMPNEADVLNAAVESTRAIVPGVEVSFQ
ncbi:hypothetical protein CYFUS_000842 [Cystobacter fuscus]|uniref:Uncharacterized protein n=1 Tax=Cystobacter fuscus TaxID=43 RepID=A0A250IUK7_9BACT|nr:hypothetical protein [Cystobacter fuscus]ATB35429.1 hypothetical protein CYFUS_000842 [Cystobacter fuscus]